MPIMTVLQIDLSWVHKVDRDFYGFMQKQHHMRSWSCSTAKEQNIKH